MLSFILSFFWNGILVLAIVFLFALSITSLLNPTASLQDIFNHWKKTFKGEI